MVKEAALAFSEQKLLPFASQWDEESYFPVEVFRGRLIFQREIIGLLQESFSYGLLVGNISGYWLISVSYIYKFDELVQIQ